MPSNIARTEPHALNAPPGHDEQVADHLPHLRRMSYALTRNRADAEDLAQDACVRALRRSNGFRPGTNLKAWLSAILRNLTRNHQRDEGRRLARFKPATDATLFEAAPAESSPDRALLTDVVGPHLQAALESLPKALRDTVWLRDVEDLSYAEIADRLRIPIGTVMSRIARGRRLLHDRLVASALGPGSQPHARNPQ